MAITPFDITLRDEKGARLTIEELDNNFRALRDNIDALISEATAARTAEAVNANAIINEATIARLAEAENLSAISSGLSSTATLQMSIADLESSILDLKIQHPDIFTVDKTISILSSRNFVNETSYPTVTFTVTTTNFIDASDNNFGDEIFYTISGTNITQDDFAEGTELTGSLGVGSKIFTHEIRMNKDETTESGLDEILKFTVNVPNYPELSEETTLIVKDTSYDSVFYINDYTADIENTGTSFYDHVKNENLNAVVNLNISELYVTPEEQIQIVNNTKADVAFPQSDLVALNLTQPQIDEFVTLLVHEASDIVKVGLSTIMPELNNNWNITQADATLIPSLVDGDTLTAGSSTYIIDTASEYVTSLVFPQLLESQKLDEATILSVAVQQSEWSSIDPATQDQLIALFLTLQDIVWPIINGVLDAMTATVKLYDYRKLVELYPA